MSINPTLISSIHQMYVVWLPTNNWATTCQITHDYDPSTLAPSCDPSNEAAWSGVKGSNIANTYVTRLSTTAQAQRLLALIGKWSPYLQSCPQAAVQLSDSQYIYLWNVETGPFCKVVPGDGQISYSSINQVKHLLTGAGPQGSDAVNSITQGFRANLNHITLLGMREACQATMQYSDMSQSALAELCGCYIAVPTVAQPNGDLIFTPVEQEFLEQNPQCMPSCLDAAVRYAPSGVPIPCNQNTCIANDLNVSGIETSISQVCTQCSNRFQCVCYIHLNGRNLENQGCNTVYEIDAQGKITGTSHNSPAPAGSGLKTMWQVLTHSKYTKFVLIGVLLFTMILLGGILLFRSLRGRTRVTRRSMPPEDLPHLSYAMSTPNRS